VSAPVERRQFLLLCRNSIRRLINAAVLARDIDPIPFAIWVTGVVAVPPAMFAFAQMVAYAALTKADTASVSRVAFDHRMFFVVYGMLAAALLAALLWESLLPDATDQEIVGVLPVRARTLAAARLAAAIVIAIAFAAAIAVPAAVLFAIVATTHPALGFLPMVLIGHIVAVMGASVMVFLGLLVVRAILAVCAGAHMAERLATSLQLATIIALVCVLFYLPGVRTGLVEHMVSGEPQARWMPPIWFASLYNAIAGTSRTVMVPGALIAVAALLTVLALAVVSYVVPAQLMARRAMESRFRRHAGSVTAAMRALAPLLAAAPRVGAIVAFSLASLARNRRHLLVVASYAGLGLASALITTISGNLLPVPLIMMFFLALGVKAAFEIPTELDANWIFRARPPAVDDAVAATRLALLLAAIAPVILGTAAATAVVGWPPRPIVVLALLNLSAGVLLIECVVRGWTKIPFTCAHAPAEGTIKFRWLLLLLALYVFAFRGADLEEAALGSWWGTASFVAGCCVAAAIVRLMSTERRRPVHVPFDVEANNGFATLDLSEALR
jgi:hypothetical protein